MSIQDDDAGQGQNEGCKSGTEWKCTMNNNNDMRSSTGPPLLKLLKTRRPSMEDRTSTSKSKESQYATAPQNVTRIQGALTKIQL